MNLNFGHMCWVENYNTLCNGVIRKTDTSNSESRAVQQATRGGGWKYYIYVCNNYTYLMTYRTSNTLKNKHSLAVFCLANISIIASVFTLISL